MDTQLYPMPTGELTRKRRQLAPEVDDAFRRFSRLVFSDGALDAKTKQLIAVAVAHVTQCPYCIRWHTKAARHQRATEQEIVESIWVAAEMRAGGAVAHSLLAVQAMEADGHDGEPGDTR
jgi:AhpD family alkylhydroperoxidase